MGLLAALRRMFRPEQTDPLTVVARTRFSAALDSFNAAHVEALRFAAPSDAEEGPVLARGDRRRDTAPAPGGEARIAGGHADDALDAHRVATRRLDTAFDALIAALAALSRADALYEHAAEVCDASARVFAIHAENYADAASRALGCALHCKTRALEHKWEAILLTDSAERRVGDDAAAATAQALAARAAAERECLVAERGAEAATEAQAHAERLRMKATSAISQVGASLRGRASRVTASEG